jgi:formylglycine-generating enzyme required for sulfatase activity
MPQVLRWQSSTQAFIEPLGEGQALTMLRIPAGRFLMGSPDHESGRDDDEGPLHEVELQEFLMASTPITQAQWRAVAAWQLGPGETWRSSLPLDPSPFQGERASLSEGESDTSQRPVERISWEEAMEFCRRLSQRSGRMDTLPSEAQWEYACRAGTTTPFCFGDTISPERANYAKNSAHADGSQGIYREQTTPVGMFPANAWGLLDMHGNVWECCLDEWHASYEGAPADGRAWLDGKEGEKSNETETTRLLRGGSWLFLPSFCRSACRERYLADVVSGSVGFRVVYLPQGPFP